MANVAVYNMEGNEVGTMELSDAVFGVEVKENLVHQAVVLHLANRRQGTQKAKTRSEVSGGGRKPWRQKGTGHARQGSIRAPQWTGGGVVFAPVPRDYSFKMNKKEKRLALKSALTSKVLENKFLVLDELKLDAVKTKEMKKVLDNSPEYVVEVYKSVPEAQKQIIISMIEEKRNNGQYVDANVIMRLSEVSGHDLMNSIPIED